jgi:radical SAM protein with 4Fe4S-binding SPASM domain
MGDTMSSIRKTLVERTTLRFVGRTTTTDFIRRVFNKPMALVDGRLLPGRALSIPYTIQLEPTNKCNLKCQMCHRSIVPLSGIGEMKFTDFKKIIDPLLPYLEAVWLQGEGEPFLCKDIFGMIKYLKRRLVYVNTVTNGTLLSKDVCRKIISSGLDEIAISIDGATAETYEQIRIGANFEEVTKKIKTLTSLLNHSSRKNLKVAAFVVAMKENIHELPDLVTLIHRLGVKYLWVQDVQFQQLNAGLAKKEESLRVLAEQDGREKERIEHYLKAALRLANKYDLQILTYGGKSIFNRLSISRERRKCSWPWTSAYITWDGFVAPCCIPSTYFCGNLLEEPFRKIWNDNKYRDFRRRLKSGKFPYQCVNCSFL